MVVLFIVWFIGSIIVGCLSVMVVLVLWYNLV